MTTLIEDRRSDETTSTIAEQDQRRGVKVQ
jgi:hypothetical protein